MPLKLLQMLRSNFGLAEAVLLPQLNKLAGFKGFAAKAGGLVETNEAGR